MSGALLAIMTGPKPIAPPTPHLARAMAGERPAMEALLGDLLPRARNLIRYLVRGDGEVDDIAQEALIAIARGVSGFRGDGRFEAWADRIVARTTFAHLRRSKKHMDGRDDRRPPEDLGVTEPLDERYASRRAAVRLLDQLPEPQRHVLVLHHVLGMTVPEISSQLDTPAETIRSRLRLGKKRLREAKQRHDRRRTPTNADAHRGGTW